MPRNLLDANSASYIPVILSLISIKLYNSIRITTLQNGETEMRDRSLGASSRNYWPGPYIVLETSATAGTWLDDKAVDTIRAAAAMGKYVETVGTPYERDSSVDSPRVLSVVQVGVEYPPARRVIEVVMLEWRPLANTPLDTRRITIKAYPGSSLDYDDRKLLNEVGPSDVAGIMQSMIIVIRQNLSSC